MKREKIVHIIENIRLESHGPHFDKPPEDSSECWAIFFVMITVKAGPQLTE